jgi:short-subunit dehydrogenase
LAAEKVAAAALAALEKNQPFIVPGATNKIMGALSALLGRRRSRNLFARLMRSVVPAEHRANAGID